jgi:hypothetical protein
MNANERDEARLARLLAAARAEADPAALARARARIAARAAVPRAVVWLGTPAALASACALLVLAAGLAFTALRTDSAGTRGSSYMSALMGDDDSYGLPSASSSSGDAGGADSEEVSL